MERIKQILDNITLVAGRFIVISIEDAKYLYNNRKQVEKYLIENGIIEMEVYFPCIENQNHDFYMNLIKFFASGVNLFGFNDRSVNFYELRSSNGYSYCKNGAQKNFYNLLNKISKSSIILSNRDKAELINDVQSKNDIAKVLNENRDIFALIFSEVLHNIYLLSYSLDDNLIYNECSRRIEQIMDDILNHIGINI